MEQQHFQHPVKVSAHRQRRDNQCNGAGGAGVADRPGTRQNFPADIFRNTRSAPQRTGDRRRGKARLFRNGFQICLHGENILPE